MYVDDIQLLMQRAEWKVANAYNHYTFEQENFKKEFVLGDQIAKQKAVAKNNDVQASFYSLMDNSNFGYDYRDNSKNRSIQLIYD